MKRLPAYILWIFPTVLLLWTAAPLWCSELGLDLIHNRADRFTHPDRPDSVNSKIVRLRQLLFWQPDIGEDQTVRVVLEQENYALQGGDDTDFILLRLRKAHPRYRLRQALWGLDASVLAVDVGRESALFQKIPQDGTDRFYLPALIADLTPRPLLFRVGGWEEYDILPLDFNTYSFAVSRNFLVGVGYELTPDATIRLNIENAERVYPSTLDLERTNYTTELRWVDPLSKQEEAVWREFSAELSRKHYPLSGERFHELLFQGVFRLPTGSVTHFLTPQLRLADSFVVFRRGGLPESLLEDNVPETDVDLNVIYEGFTRIRTSPFFLAWGGTWEQSLVQRVRRTAIVHVKITYTY